MSKDFVKVGTLLRGTADRSMSGKSMEAAYVLELVNREISVLFGDQAVGNVCAIRYRNGVLTFGVKSSAWAQEVKMREREVLSLFQSKLYLVRVFVRV